MKEQETSLDERFSSLVLKFIQKAFASSILARSQKWKIVNVRDKNEINRVKLAHYERLDYFTELAKTGTQLSTAALGNNVVLLPDILLYRNGFSDAEINAPFPVVDGQSAKNADLRASNGNPARLQAVISTLWQMENTKTYRTEAVQVVQKANGLPYFFVVTGETLPSQLASLLWMGKMDCIYHFALPELVQVVQKAGEEDAGELLYALINEKRLKDISDLPLDLVST